MNRGVTYSLLLHLTAVLVARLDFSNLFRNNEVVSVVPISVDLSQVKISEVTNLPPESEEKPKEEEPPPPEEKAEKAPEPPKYVPPSEEVKPEPKPIPPPEEKPSGMELKEPEEKQDKKPPKEEPKEAKTPPPKPKPKPYKAPKPKPKNEDSLSSLLASVGQIEKNLKPKTNNTEETKKPVTGGIKGGTGGFLGRELTISEKDALAS